MRPPTRSSPLGCGAAWLSWGLRLDAVAPSLGGRRAGAAPGVIVGGVLVPLAAQVGAVYGSARVGRPRSRAMMAAARLRLLEAVSTDSPSSAATSASRCPSR